MSRAKNSRANAAGLQRSEHYGESRKLRAQELRTRRKKEAQCQCSCASEKFNFRRTLNATKKLKVSAADVRDRTDRDRGHPSRGQSANGGRLRPTNGDCGCSNSRALHAIGAALCLLVGCCGHGL